MTGWAGLPSRASSPLHSASPTRIPSASCATRFAPSASVEKSGTVLLPVVAETHDGWLSDAGTFPVTTAHACALDGAISGPVRKGNVVAARHDLSRFKVAPAPLARRRNRGQSLHGRRTGQANTARASCCAWMASGGPGDRPSPCSVNRKCRVKQAHHGVATDAPLLQSSASGWRDVPQQAWLGSVASVSTARRHLSRVRHRQPWFVTVRQSVAEQCWRRQHQPLLLARRRQRESDSECADHGRDALRLARSYSAPLPSIVWSMYAALSRRPRRQPDPSSSPPISSWPRAAAWPGCPGQLSRHRRCGMPDKRPLTSERGAIFRHLV